MSDDLIKRLSEYEKGWNNDARQKTADYIKQLERERDGWKSRYEHHNHERLETLNLNAMQASKIGSLMNKIATLEKEIKDLRGSNDLPTL